MRGKKFTLLAVLLILALLAQPAWAVQKIISIQVGDKTAYSNGTSTTVYTNSKKSDITVKTENDVDKVSIDGVTVSSATYTFTYSNYEFYKGENLIYVRARDSSGATTDSVVSTVYYYEADEFYRLDNLFSGSGRITAFDKAFSLDVGKGNWFKNSSNDATDDVGLNVAVESRINDNFRSNTYLDFYSCVGPVYHVSTDSTASVKLAKPCTLAISIDKGVPATQYPNLTIVRSKDNFNTVEIMGGVADLSRKTISTDPFLDLPGYSYTVMLYNRVIDAGWAVFSVTPLMAKDAINKSVITALDTNTTRRDFAKMMVKGLGVTLLPLPLPSVPVFSDIPVADTDRLYIETAAAYGIMRGYNDGTFRPDNPITREEAAAVLANVAELKLVEDETLVTPVLDKIYTDSASISSWAAPAVLAVSKAKLMMGSPSGIAGEKRTVFAPTNNMNYKEAATIVYNLMKKKKRI